ncbi:MAG: NUDIX domain-containing protein [Bacteroidales bacterium]|nr:NUDIX domain-containing protein [Bacteroidales bacterium]
MKTIAAIILENRNGELLLYKRDNKPGIPFPGYWDLIGGHVEDGETPEQALVREIKEELNIDFTNFVFFKEYLCTEKDAYPNVKYIYAGIIDIPIDKITLLEGDYPMYFKKEQIKSLDIANIQKHILIDYIDSDL